MDNNNLLLIVLVIALFFLIKNMNTPTTNKKVEKFGKVESPLLSRNNMVDQSYDQAPAQMGSVSSNQIQELLTKPPVVSTSNQSMVNSMASQYVSNDKQEMYSNLTTPDKQTANLSTINDSYMLLPSNNLPDDKFNKVLSKEPARSVLTSGDLLPKDENKDWFQVPNSKFNLMQAVDLEVPEIKIGVDTVGQSRKNATYDLRAAPPNPKFVVSPWSNSTIEPDYNTKPLC